jgi:hypothetical protein
LIFLFLSAEAPLIKKLTNIFSPNAPNTTLVVDVETPPLGATHNAADDATAEERLSYVILFMYVLVKFKIN